MLEESILNSIKKDLGMDADYDAFDTDIRMHINGLFSVLYQIGVESAKNQFITGPEETWCDIFGADLDLIPLVHSYIYTKVRIAFDPPSNSFVLDSLNKQASEYEWRINIQAEGGFDSF